MMLCNLIPDLECRKCPFGETNSHCPNYYQAKELAIEEMEEIIYKATEVLKKLNREEKI